MRSCLFRPYVSRVEGCLSLDEQDVALIFSDRVVPHASWDNEHLTFIQLDGSVFHLDAKMSFENEEHLIFVVVGMPCQRSKYLRHLDIRVIQFADHTWRLELSESSSNCFR